MYISYQANENNQILMVKIFYQCVAQEKEREGERESK